MLRLKPNGTEKKPSRKNAKCTAYLIAVHQGREAVRVYAVVTTTVDAALIQVRAMATDTMRVEVVGSLSRESARRLRLKRDEMLLV